jgi:guanosine-3',5'-bis(diphosphate) 3'-pyrophosphohydrolase
VTYDVALLLKAARFSAEKHRSQRRKGEDALPYINHPIEVADLLANVGGITDLQTLVAAVLHDTVEDTGTTFEELELLFGQEVRALVGELTDDKKLPKAERKRLQVEHASRMSGRAKAIKIADKICNVRDVTHNPPSGWSVETRRQYLRWAQNVVAGCRGSNPGLEKRFDEVAQEGWSKLGREP